MAKLKLIARRSNMEEGGSFTYYIVKATKAQLVKEFGGPHYTDSVDEKVQYQWQLELNDKARTLFYIYDWKEYREISPDEIIEWHIGANRDSANVSRIVDALKGMGFDVLNNKY